jgi:peptide/nickel transport system substrate-binding protein
MSITIWSQPSFGIDYTSTGRYLVSLLDSLGYKARLKTFGANDTSFFGFASPSRKHQAAFTTAVPAYPAASEFIPYFFSCQYIVGAGPLSLGSNISEFCSPRLDATIASALAAEGANSPAWPYLWANADRQVTDAAPFVPLVNPRELDFVSARVGDYQYNPVQGPLLDQLWVR